MNENDFRLALHQKLYEIADMMMDHYDPCQIVGSSCKAFSENKCCIHTTYGEGLCEFMIDNQCARPNVACRVWICNTAIQGADDKCVEGLKLLEQFAALYDMTRKPFIGHPYSGADKQPT